MKSSLEKRVIEICNNEDIKSPLITYPINGEINCLMSTILKLKIHGGNKDLHLIAKCAPKNEDFRKLTFIEDLYNNEIHFYTNIVPAFRKLQLDHKSANSFEETAKLFGFDVSATSETIFLEDVEEAGYKLKNCLVPMDDAHLKIVLEEYGKYHALSHALKYHDKECYENLVSNIRNLHEKFVTSHFSVTQISALRGISSLYDDNEQEKLKIQALLNVCDKFMELYPQFAQADEHSVIVHGDAWCNNIMFKYEDESGIPTRLKFLDFALIGHCSAVFDISYFLMANASPECIKNVDHYLRVYHKSLSAHLRALNCDPDVVYSYSTLLKQWKKCSLYGMVMAISALKHSMTSIGDYTDMVKDFEDCVVSYGKNVGEYKKRADAILTYFYDAKII